MTTFSQFLDFRVEDSNSYRTKHSFCEAENLFEQQTIRDAIAQTLIIAYKEDTQQLETCLTEQGFDCRVIRQQHRPEYKDYSPSYLCLLNHRTAWQRVIELNRPVLICEADFVPVKRLAQRPLPYDATLPDVGIAWLYTCAPQIYSVSSQNHAIGFSTSMVAYILTPAGAKELLDHADRIAHNPGPTHYSAWDSEIEGFLRKRQLNGYVPWRNYGEHGGKPNPEHKKAGLSPAHRADVLYGPLAFIPTYTEGQQFPWLHVLCSRVKARIKGLGRLMLGKYLRPYVLSGSTKPITMLKFALGRQVALGIEWELRDKSGTPSKAGGLMSFPSVRAGILAESIYRRL